MVKKYVWLLVSLLMICGLTSCEKSESEESGQTLSVQLSQNEVTAVDGIVSVEMTIGGFTQLDYLEITKVGSVKSATEKCMKSSLSEKYIYQYTVNEQYNVGGTDLGIVWELQPGRYGLFFGDTFGSDFYPNFVNPGPNGGSWRSNVLLFSEDSDLSDGLVINGAAMDESGKNAREICYGGKDGSGNGDWTSIPTAAIRANGTDYVHYMNIRNWAGWMTNYSSLYKSIDNGANWVRCQDVKFGSMSNFGQVGYFKKDGYVYMVGTITGRDNKPHLARFHEENIEKQSEYEFWNGSGWAKDNETAAVPLFDDIAGELSVAYHPKFNKWILLYFNGTRYEISFRAADHITGPWSEPAKLVDGWQYAQLYGSFIHPLSLEGDTLYFIMSMWLPYNSYLMSVELLSK